MVKVALVRVPRVPLTAPPAAEVRVRAAVASASTRLSSVGRLSVKLLVTWPAGKTSGVAEGVTPPPTAVKATLTDPLRPPLRTTLTLMVPALSVVA